MQRRPVLADDRRTWAPSTPFQGLWQRLRLAVLTCLLAAHRAAQAQRTARAVAARILGHMWAALQGEWLLVGGGLRRAAFVERWCHRRAHCMLPAKGVG